MRTTRLRATSDIVHHVLSVTAEIAREHRALRRAVKRMPKPMPWDWAAPRMLPILSCPSFDQPGEALVRVRSEIGPMVQFGIDLGGVLSYVDEVVAERWECSGGQLMERALRNLGERSSRVEPTRVITGVMSGRSIRMLRDRPAWVASLVLAPDDLFRLFGDHDQILATPTASCLISLPLDTPPPVVADIVIDFERTAFRPLWLDPFIVIDRQVLWGHDAADEGDSL